MKNAFEESITNAVPYREIAVYLEDGFLEKLFVYKRTRNTQQLQEALEFITEGHSKYEIVSEIIDYYEDDSALKLHWKFMNIQLLFHMTVKKYVYYKQTDNYRELAEIIRNVLQMIWLEENSPELF